MLDGFVCFVVGFFLFHLILAVTTQRHAPFNYSRLRIEALHCIFFFLQHNVVVVVVVQTVKKNKPETLSWHGYIRTSYILYSY